MNEFFNPSNLILNYFVAAILIFMGIYCMAASRNILKLLIGIEVASKGCMMAILTAGYALNKINYAQALIILMVGVEVIVIAVALSLIIKNYIQQHNVDAWKLKKLKG